MGALIIRILLFRVLYWGPLIFGNSHLASVELLLWLSMQVVATRDHMEEVVLQLITTTNISPPYPKIAWAHYAWKTETFAFAPAEKDRPKLRSSTFLPPLFPSCCEHCHAKVVEPQKL